MKNTLQTLLKTLALTAVLATAQLAQAIDIKPYDEAAFSAAQAAGKSSVLMFHASWCPTCKLQDKSLDALKSDPELKNVVLFKADFDKAVELKQTHKVRGQSTFVVFKGKDEVSRSTAETQPDTIKALFKKAV